MRSVLANPLLPGWSAKGASIQAVAEPSEPSAKDFKLPIRSNGLPKPAWTPLADPRLSDWPRLHDADASSEPGCSRDQSQPCPDDDGPDGARGALTARCETFDGDGRRHD